MEERIKDSYYYEPQGAKDGLKVYTSKQDPNATAIDLIDAVYGSDILLRYAYMVETKNKLGTSDFPKSNKGLKSVLIPVTKEGIF